MDYQARQTRYEYSKQFSWPETARATLKAFADCVGDAQRKRVAVSAGVDHE
jgi:hypothetical protein